MDHISGSPLQYVNHNYTQSRFIINKLNIASQVSFNKMDINNQSKSLSTFIESQRFISRQELQFKPVKYSQLVGGFVGSKSQLGTSNRISCQIWDIIFCKLMSFMNPSNIKAATSLKNSHYPYELMQNLATDIMFDTMYKGISDHHNKCLPRNHFTSSAIQVHNVPNSSEKQNVLDPSLKQSDRVSKHSQMSNCNKFLENSKQSYADVTKTAKQIQIMEPNVKCRKTSHTNDLRQNAKGQWHRASQVSYPSNKRQHNWWRKRTNAANGSANISNNMFRKEGSRLYNTDKSTSGSSKIINRSLSNNMEGIVNKCTKKGFSNSDDKSISCWIKQLYSPTKVLSQNDKTECETVTDVEDNYFEQSIMHSPNKPSEDCNEKDQECKTDATKGSSMVLPKRPSFSHGVHNCNIYKSSRMNSDSSDSDDFVIFAVAESDTLSQSDSEEQDSDCDSACDADEAWNAVAEKDSEEQEEKPDEPDNQIIFDLKEINERWQKAYSCSSVKAKELKKVHFASDEKLKTMHSIIAWDFAYRAARIGPWEQIARDQQRFAHRILQLEHIIAPVLSVEHRLHVYQRTVKQNYP